MYVASRFVLFCFVVEITCVQGHNEGPAVHCYLLGFVVIVEVVLLQFH